MIKWIVTAVVILAIVYFLLPNLYAILGGIEYEKSGYNKALKYFEKAYKTGRASFNTKQRYGILALRNGEPELSERIFAEIAIDPKTSEERRNIIKQYRCMAYLKQGKIDMAEEDASELLEQYENSQVYGILGYAKLLKNSPDSMEFCKKAYDYNMDNRDIADNYAVALSKSGRHQEAVEVCDKVISKNRFFPEAHFHKAEALFELGRLLEASDELDLLEDCNFNYLTTFEDEDIDNLRSKIEELKNA